MAASRFSDDERTLWVGNIDSSVSEEILWELFLQAAPVESVRIPKDFKTGRQRNFAFVVFYHEVSVQYVIDLMDGINLFGSPLTLNHKSKDTSKGNEENGDRLTPKAMHNHLDQEQDYQRPRHEWGPPCRPPLNFPPHANPFFVTQYPFQNMHSWEARSLPPHRHMEGAHFRHGAWSGNDAHADNGGRMSELHRRGNYS